MRWLLSWIRIRWWNFTFEIWEIIRKTFTIWSKLRSWNIAVLIITFHFRQVWYHLTKRLRLITNNTIRQYSWLLTKWRVWKFRYTYTLIVLSASTNGWCEPDFLLHSFWVLFYFQFHFILLRIRIHCTASLVSAILLFRFLWLFFEIFERQMSIYECICEFLLSNCSSQELVYPLC